MITPRFLDEVHDRITRKALDRIFPSPAVTAIVAANVGQDDGDAFDDPLNHGDDNLIEGTVDRVRGWVADAQDRLNNGTGDPQPVLADIGKACHALQDLVSHSTYVETMTADGGFICPAYVPAPDFIENGRPPGVVTGFYDPNNPQQHGTPGNPTHEDINKDGPTTPRGSQPVPGMGNTIMFDVAENVAIRETAGMVMLIADGLNPTGQAAWQQMTSPGA